MRFSSKIQSLIFPLFPLLLLLACKKDNTVTNPEVLVNTIVSVENTRLDAVLPKTLVTAYLEGTILDDAGKPVSDVTVSTNGKFTSTDATGYFTFGELPLKDQYAVVTAKKAGFMIGTRTFTPRKGAFHKIEIHLMSKGPARVFTANAGGAIDFESGKVKLIFPSQAIITKSGTRYSGEVRVFSRYIDPVADNFAGIMPGMLAGLTNGNDLTSLISHGMVSVEMEDASGNPLEVAAGSQVQVNLPALASSPAEIPIWHFNESRGLWVESGSATKQGSQYVFQANCFSSWNLDTRETPYDVTVTLQNEAGTLPNQKVEVYTSNYGQHLKTVWSDNEGKFTLVRAPQNTVLRIVACSNNIDKALVATSGSATVIISNEDLQSAGSRFYSLSGIITDCGIQMYDNAYFSISDINNPKTNFTGKTDANGNYQVTSVLCNVSNTESLQLKISVYLSLSSIKTDTVSLVLSGNNQNKALDFCGSVEEEVDVFNPSLTYGSMSDIEGNSYKTIKIGTQTWMAENLKVSKYQNGDSIPIRVDSTGWENATNGMSAVFLNLPTLKKRYGKLYNWFTVTDSRNVCPAGWHTPTDSEWTTLENFLVDSTQLGVGGKLKSQSYLWKVNAFTSETNASGFSGIPGGILSPDWSFGELRFSANWWSASEGSQTNGIYRQIDYYQNILHHKTIEKQAGLSIRCIKD
ncbi:MAG TPA: FISUMP domain-containing protein [Catalimonadaceae bacterium]|nr:FISUMP domain-containing protein [Catalimonadaceae bacterium]